jgi:hypothetical protein
LSPPPAERWETYRQFSRDFFLCEKIHLNLSFLFQIPMGGACFQFEFDPNVFNSLKTLKDARSYVRWRHWRGLPGIAGNCEDDRRL